MKMRLTRNDLKRIVTETAMRVAEEDQRRSEIDAAWEEFDKRRERESETMEQNRKWMEFLDGWKKDTETERAWDDHDGNGLIPKFKIR